MSPRAPAHIVASIKSDYFGLISTKNIIIRHPEVAQSTVYLLIKNLKEHGAAYPILHAEPQPFGRRRLITPAIEDDVVELLMRAPTYYLDEIRHWILMNYNIWISESTVCRTIKRKEFTRKVTQRVASQRDEGRRLQYYLDLAAFTKDQLVYVDESAANERTLLRKYGFAPRGLLAIDVQLLRRSTRWSILPALTITGYLNGTLIIQGSVTGDIFLRWLREVILP
jgi:transposase